MKKIVFIFIISFLLNLIWENLHSLLYDNYMFGVITQLVLFKATLGDAVMITLISLPFLYLDFFKRNKWLIIPIGLIVAISIEIYALSVGRWGYNSFMPIIPFLNVGFTPTIQLALLGYLSIRFIKI